MKGITEMQCGGAGGTNCSLKDATQELHGPSGTIEVWQDDRITASLREYLWGRSGGEIAFGTQMPARNAVIVLRDAKGVILAEETEKRALADIDPVFVGSSKPAFLVSVDFNNGMTVDSAFITR
jgi:hypothetical protein